MCLSNLENLLVTLAEAGESRHRQQNEFIQDLKGNIKTQMTVCKRTK